MRLEPTLLGGLPREFGQKREEEIQKEALVEENVLVEGRSGGSGNSNVLRIAKV